MLSKKTKYGLKALVHISKKEPGEKVAISDIAKAENISQKFLEAILLDLRKNGVLGSKKGKGGGYYLLKDPAEIQMAPIIRILEGPIAWLPCVSLNYYEKCDDCTSEKECSINSFMIEVRDSILDVLQNKTLKEVAEGK